MLRFLVNRMTKKKNQLSGISFCTEQQTGTLLSLCATKVNIKAAAHPLRVHSQWFLYRGLSHLGGYIRRITYSRQRKGLLAHYAGDVRVAARWARRHHGQVAHDLQHFYPGQHRETFHRRNMATAGMEEEEDGACGLHFLARPGWQARSFSVLLCRPVSRGTLRDRANVCPRTKSIHWRGDLTCSAVAQPAPGTGATVYICEDF